MTLTLGVLLAVIVVALVFDYTNGFHDAANAVATSIATRALTPRIALSLAAVMNFAGALLGTRVAHTVTEVIGPPAGRDGLVIVLGALAGAIVWNLATWWWGLPSSSSHALIGGLAGSAIAGGASVHWSTIVTKVVVPMVASPALGFLGAFALMIGFMWLLRRRNPRRVQRGFRMLQVFSAAALALGHGLQDAQKTMGVIFLALLTAYPARYAADGSLPLWVIVAAASAISLGTFSGGWRVMRTVGQRIVTLDPARGFAAEFVGAVVLYAAALAKAPVSTTHVITSAVMGAGSTRRMRAVRWGTARTIVVAWVVTFPAAGLSAYVACLVLRAVVPG